MSFNVGYKVEKARVFALAAHGAIGQKRKYTGEDYIVHPMGVAMILMDVVGDILTENMIAATLLHDVLEDTQITIPILYSEFGMEITSLVIGLTKVSKESDGTRKVRKAKDRDFLAQQSAEVQTIKVADLIHNTKSIVEHDKEFAKVYLAEKADLLKVLTKADKRLLDIAHKQLNEALLQIEGEKVD